jgi:polyphosphate kinase
MSTKLVPLLNRELGQLEFNRRVLAQAENPQTPILERLRFVCIVSSNMDEFFEIRMSGLKEQLRENPLKVLADGQTVQDSYRQITLQARQLIEKKYRLLQEVIFPQLNQEKIFFKYQSAWTKKQRLWARNFFHTELVPVLTPIALDPAHPFPKVINKSLNLLKLKIF